MESLVRLLGLGTIVLLTMAGVSVVNCPGGACEGTGGDDEIYGTHGVDTIRGYGGEDFVLARPGMDEVFGGPGADRLYGGEQDDRIYAGAGHDYARGKGGDDRMYGGPGREDFYGGTESDDVRTGVVRGQDGAPRPDGVRDYVNCGPDRDTVHYERAVDVVENCEDKRPM